MSSHAPSMDVKVLYTLDSSPAHTMVARVGRPIPVDVIIPNITPPSPLGASSSNYHAASPPRHVRFGRVALKTCLGAVCMASPELLPDGKRDYIIYAVDPEETLRANQLRSPSSHGQSSPSRSASSTSLRDRTDPSSSKLPASPPRAKDAPTSILVGKGFFNWALEEHGDGDTTVTGRVRSDGRRLCYDNGREYQEDINVLEVVIKLKESQARSKDKYFNLVRGLAPTSTPSSFSAASSSSSSSRPPSSSRTAADIEPPASPTHRFRSRHSHRDHHITLHSEPDYPTSADSPIESHSRRSLGRPLHRAAPLPADTQAQRDLSPKTAPQHLDPSPGLPLHPTFAASSSSSSSQQPPSASSPTAASSAAATNPSTLQLLTILHSLQQRSSKSAPEPAQQAQLENLLQQVAQVFGTASPASPSDAPLSSPALRPLEPIPVPNARSPAPQPASDAPTATAPPTVQSGKENRRVSLSTQAAIKDSPQIGSAEHNSRRPSASSPAFDQDDAAPSPSVQRKEHDSANRICYNCGTSVPTTWRILKLPAGSIINNPSAEKPAAAANDANADDPESGWKPRYAPDDSPIQADGESRWSACNPCGLYYLKWSNSRPEYVWRKEHATKAYRERKALAEAAKRRRDTVEAAGSSKRARVANSDADAASPYSAAATPHGANKLTSADADARHESTSPNYDASTPASSSGRKASMPRTLSEACHRDAEKLESQRSTKKKEKEKPLCKKQADREYVLDHNTGKWRSRRSMRENPEGKRPGRPKGSVKVPQNAAKPNAANSSPPNSTKDDSQMQSKDASAKQTDAGSSSKNSGGDASGSEPSEPTNKVQSATAARQSEGDFRLPAPPQPMAPQLARQASTSRMVNFAQSSPVRPSMNASLMQPDAVNALHRFGAHMLESPSRDVRFRVPSYLMNSSPGTMLDTLMSEADFDFEELGPLGPLQTPGTLLGNVARDSNGTPMRLRRSPRKNPHGTISGQNPYASPTAERGASPSSGREMRRAQVPESPSRRSVAPSSSASPVTRSRTRSGQGVLHPALYSSSDGADNAHGKSSSNVTSPASPSEAAGKGKAKAKTASSLQATKTQLATKQAQVEASARAASRRRCADADDDDDNEPEAQFVKGPYQSAASREGSAGLPSCPASPSLGRAHRKLGRHLSSVSAHSPQSGAATLAKLDLPPSSPAFDPPTARSSNSIEVDGWGRTPSMREIFPTPSDLDWPSDASPATQGEAPAKAPAEVAQQPEPSESKELVVNPTTAVVRRRPLPATVEDGSSSVSGSSPARSEDSPEGSTGNMFDLLEDPYGILAASGFGIDADGALTSLEIPVPASTEQQQMTPSSSSAATGSAVAPSISADKFNDVSLHPAQEFGAHLTDFNSSGGVGVAAHVAGTGTAAAVQIANTTDGEALVGGGMDAGFLASLPRELSAILTSPKKQIPPKIIELLASPSKNKFADPPSPGLERVQSETHDFSALFANPDIQALLAEFESMP